MDVVCVDFHHSIHVAITGYHDAYCSESHLQPLRICLGHDQRRLTRRSHPPRLPQARWELIRFPEVMARMVTFE